MAKTNTVATYDSTITIVELFEKKENRRKLAVFSLCEAESVVGLVKCKIAEYSSTVLIVSLLPIMPL